MTTVFLDTETLGLDRAAPIWEFATIRINDRGLEEAREHFTIRHTAGNWLATLPEAFVRDYQTRYDARTALPPWTAAERIAAITAGRPVIAGSNPSFDMERLGDLLYAQQIEPDWHYHPCDVPTMAIGWLAARGKLIPRPWKSDELSAAVGVDPSKYDRHTAMGDVLWTRDLYVAITGGAW